MSGYAPKISVIVPVYNCGEYVGSCLDSIVSQDYPDLEIIVVDDGSTDYGATICRAFAALDSRVVLIRRPNGGLSAARNTGLDRATGDYVAFVDGDDYLDPDMFTQYLPWLEAMPDGLLISGHKAVRDGIVVSAIQLEGGPVGRETALEELYEDVTFRNYMWNKLYPRHLFDGLRFPEGHVYEDVVMQFRLFERAAGIMKCPFAGYNYVLRSGGISKVPSLRNTFDCVEAYVERLETAECRTSRLLRPMTLGLFRAYVDLALRSLYHYRDREAFRERRHVLDNRLYRLDTDLKAHLAPHKYAALAVGRSGTVAGDATVAALKFANTARCFVRDLPLALRKIWRLLHGVARGENR